MDASGSRSPMRLQSRCQPRLQLKISIQHISLTELLKENLDSALAIWRKGSVSQVSLGVLPASQMSSYRVSNPKERAREKLQFLVWLSLWSHTFPFYFFGSKPLRSAHTQGGKLNFTSLMRASKNLRIYSKTIISALPQSIVLLNFLSLCNTIHLFSSLQ